MKAIITRILTKNGTDNEYLVFNGTSTARVFNIGLIGLKNQGYEIVNAKIQNGVVSVDPIIPRTPDNILVTPDLIQYDYGILLAKYYSLIQSTQQQNKHTTKK